MRNDHIGQNAKAPVDYYMLALSWSPGFCDIQRENMAISCLIPLNINVEITALLVGLYMGYGHKMQMLALFQIILVLQRRFTRLAKRFISTIFGDFSGREIIARRMGKTR